MSRIDWDRFERTIRGEVETAARQTNEELAQRISTLVRMTDEDIQRLFPTKADKARLARLLRIVRSAESRNRKAKALADEVEDLGLTVIKLLERVL